MVKNPLVVIVVVNWNGGETIKKCIKSLKKTSYKNYKLLLIDNGSTDESVSQLKKINKKMKVIYLKNNYGYTIGMNFGWRYAINKLKADYVVAMDSDIETIQNNWLSIQIKELEKSKEYGISGGKLVFPDNTLQVLVRESRAGYYEKDNGQYDFIREVDEVWGACIIIKKEVIEKMGYYDENFFYGPNDIDYCIRARKMGFKIIYNGFAKSIHIGSYSGLSPRKDFIYGHASEGMLIYYFRHKPFLEKIGMIFRQFIRAFVTRKNPFSDFGQKGNLVFHKTFLKRSFIFIKSLGKALKNYNYIKQDSQVEEVK